MTTGVTIDSQTCFKSQWQEFNLNEPLGQFPIVNANLIHSSLAADALMDSRGVQVVTDIISGWQTDSLDS